MNPAHHVKEYRSDKYHAVDAIQDAAVAREDAAAVLHATAALEHGHEEIAGLPGRANNGVEVIVPPVQFK